MDDVLDYEAVDSQLGKPGGADLQLGLVTGPALFAWEEHPEMGPLIARKFENPGDVDLVSTLSPFYIIELRNLRMTHGFLQARDLVRRSSGVERTRALALAHTDKARELLQLLPESDARHALEALADRVVRRKS